MSLNVCVYNKCGSGQGFSSVCVCVRVRARTFAPPCVKARVCARASGRVSVDERARGGDGAGEKAVDCCVSGSFCVDLGRRLLYITFKADNIIAWPDK